MFHQFFELGNILFVLWANLFHDCCVFLRRRISVHNYRASSLSTILWHTESCVDERWSGWRHNLVTLEAHFHWNWLSTSRGHVNISIAWEGCFHLHFLKSWCLCLEWFVRVYANLSKIRTTARSHAHLWRNHRSLRDARGCRIRSHFMRARMERRSWCESTRFEILYHMFFYFFKLICG